MKLVITEDYPGEVEDLGGVRVNEKLSKAFASAKRTIAKATGLQYGQVKALGELEEIMVKAQRRRARQLQVAVAEAVKGDHA